MFYKETNFKETLTGKIPKDWNVVRLGDVILDIADGGTPPTKNKENFNGNVPWVNIKDIKRDIRSTKRHLSELGLKNSSAKLWNEGTIIFSFGASIGKVGIAKVKLCTKQGIAGIVPDTDKIRSDYLYYVLLREAGKIKQIGRSMGSTIKEVRPTKLKRLVVFPLPSLQEQQKVSEILFAIEETIKETEKIIRKVGMLKLGLMKRLLTQGIGHTKFKQTELGEMPTTWNIVRVGDVCKIIVPGRNKPRKFDGNIPWISLPDLEGMYVSSSKSGLGVSAEEIKKCGNKIIPRGSVIMSCVGKFGIVAINTRDLVINQQLHAFVCPKEINPYFLAIALMSQKKHMLKTSTKTIVPYLNKEKCNSIPIPLPSFEEQKEISKILSYVDKKIENEKRILSELQKLKEGLMQVLLTGKARAKVG